MKQIIKILLKKLNYEIRRIPEGQICIPGSASRPISNIESFLEDLRARGFSPEGIIDIGANQGHWTRLALSVYPETPVIMVEPQDEMEELLRELVAEHPNCQYIKAGAGKENGELVQTIWEDLAGSSFLPQVESKKIDSGEQRRTRIVAVDDILSRLDEFKPDIVKLDIQGFELEALSGAETLFGKTEVFILETSLFSFMPNQPLTREVISFLAEKQYEIYDITEFLRRPSDGALGSIDFAFVKREGIFRQNSLW